VIGLLRRLLTLHAKGHMSAGTHRVWLVHLRNVLRDSREWGLTAAGRPMAGLPEGFAIHDGDIPRPEADADDAGRALPQVVMNQLFAALDGLEVTDGLRRHLKGRTLRLLVELQMHEGLRPAEVCGLAWDCLTDSGGDDPRPVLVYDMPKVGRLSCRRPVSDAVASLISGQKARVRQLFPNTALGDLCLFPRPTRNPHGDNPMATTEAAMAVREWADGLPALVGPDGEPFDPSRVFMYAFRHTFAQRHADSGTPPDVLRDLMGHRVMSTTQGYYRVTDKRKRRAVDALVSLACNKDGTSVGRAMDALVEAEYQRQQIGQVAVPMGWCVESSNVKASGQACPFRYRCAGCNHFRTDPSYLPELEGYLQALLADRERLRMAGPELEDWARQDAMPSDAEIEKVRALVSKLRRRLDDLPDESRFQVDEAILQLRTTRVHAGSVPVRFLGSRRSESE